MPRRPCKFRQREITRTIKAVEAAGGQVDTIEIDPEGKIVARLRGGADPKKPSDADILLEKLQRQRQRKDQSNDPQSK